ncbi:hypothetical protein ACT3HK_11760 [Thermolongibacillus altinsuensis]
MKEFTYVIINQNKYLGLGFFDEVDKAIVIESDELIKLFAVYQKEGTIINKLVFLNRFDEIIASYDDEYIVDSINNFEVELFPIS